MCCLAAVSGQETQNRRPFLPLYPHFVSTLPHIHTFCATFWAKQCRMVPSPSIKNQKAPRREFPRGAKPRVCCALGATSGGASFPGCSSAALRGALSGCFAAVSVLRALLWGQSTDFFRSGGIWPAQNAVRRRKIGTTFFPGSSGGMLSFPVSCPFPDICQGSANIKSPVQTELHGAFIQAFSFALGSGIARCIKHSPDHLHRALRDCACSEPR